jgi:hypothetical protein
MSRIPSGCITPQTRIVWAHELPGRDRELLDYYKDREPWLLEADATPPKLTRYTDVISKVGMPDEAR